MTKTSIVAITAIGTSFAQVLPSMMGNGIVPGCSFAVDVIGVALSAHRTARKVGQIGFVALETLR